MASQMSGNKERKKLNKKNKARKKLVGLSSDDVEEKWIKYYSSLHQILLVGEGDFSFIKYYSSLHQSFGSALNIVASSLDTHDQLVRKYKKAKSNLDTLTKLGAFVYHGVDATQMENHPYFFGSRFDRIIFNFPHAGFHGKEDSSSMIKKHKKVVRGFLKNARTMLKPDGEIHINHKTTPPFDDWCIEELGSQNLLRPIECVKFKRKDYPGYFNKRGDGPRCDEPFPLGKCSTFKFALLTNKESNPRNQRILSNNHYPLRSPFGPQSSSSLCRNGHLPIFGEGGGGGYLNSEIVIQGRDGYDHVGGTACDSRKSTVFRHQETENAINIAKRLDKQVSDYVHRTSCDLKRSLLSESTVFRHAETEHGVSMDTRLGKQVSGYVHRIGSELRRSQWFESPEFRYPQTEHHRGYLNSEKAIHGRDGFDHVGGTACDLRKSTVFRHPETENTINMAMRLEKQVSDYVHGTSCDLKRSLLSESTVFRHAETEHGVSMDARRGKQVSGYVHRISSELQRSQWFESPEFRYPQTEHHINMDVICGRSASEYVNGIRCDFQSLEGEDEYDEGSVSFSVPESKSGFFVRKARWAWSLVVWIGVWVEALLPVKWLLHRSGKGSRCEL